MVAGEGGLSRKVSAVARGYMGILSNLLAVAVLRSSPEATCHGRRVTTAYLFATTCSQRLDARIAYAMFQQKWGKEMDFLGIGAGLGLCSRRGTDRLSTPPSNPSSLQRENVAQRMFKV